MPPSKKRTSRTLAPDPAELVPPGDDAAVSALRPLGSNGSSVAIVVGRKKVATVDTGWAMDEGIRTDTPWTAELAARVHAAARQHAALAHAIRLTGARQRSSFDLTRRLKMAGHQEPDARAAVEKLADLGILCDDSLATRLAEELARAGRHGRRGIENKLRVKGFKPDLASKAARLAQEEEGDPDAAQTLAHKRARQLACYEPDVARRRLYGFLIRRGFDHDEARNATEAALSSLASEDLH
ncbi:MAG: RecX family transcriptional regulator [Phycisphaera sp.]|nr:MAG: RecX family transcriptional regulator [Phycisphaera sp.]